MSIINSMNALIRVHEEVHTSHGSDENYCLRCHRLLTLFWPLCKIACLCVRVQLSHLLFCPSLCLLSRKKTVNLWRTGCCVFWLSNSHIKSWRKGQFPRPIFDFHRECFELPLLCLYAHEDCSPCFEERWESFWNEEIIFEMMGSAHDMGIGWEIFRGEKASSLLLTSLTSSPVIGI